MRLWVRIGLREFDLLAGSLAGVRRECGYRLAVQADGSHILSLTRAWDYLPAIRAFDEHFVHGYLSLSPVVYRATSFVSYARRWGQVSHAPLDRVRRYTRVNGGPKTH